MSDHTRNLRHRGGPSLAWLLSASLAVPFGPTGCGDDTNTREVECPWVRDRDLECPEAGETGADPGADSGSEAGELGPAPCSAADGTVERAVFSCAGSLRAAIDFRVRGDDCAALLGDACQERHAFGLDPLGTASAPAVMACCDADLATDVDLQTYCSVDLVEQVCRSMPARVDTLIDEKAIPAIARGKARKLRDYLATHQQDCYDALYRPSDAPGQLEPSIWTIPDSAAWHPLERVEVRLDEATLESASLPDDGQPTRVCVDQSYNNTEVFEDRGEATPDAIFTLARSSASPTRATITGPDTGGRLVVGAAELGAGSETILAVSVSRELARWTLHELELHATGPVVLGAGDLTVTVDRAAIRLYGLVHGHQAPGATATIEPGAAEFVISGTTATEVGTRWAHNRTPIVAHPSADGWALDGFEIEHVDGSGQAWVIRVPATRWGR